MGNDELFMRQAIHLAKRGGGWVNPNPQVGCVIVHDEQVIGEGWHAQYGGPHAEREALANCVSSGNDPLGATAYVTLTPCCHTGKTPPCTDALIEAGVSRVVVGSSDPNPLVAGKSIGILKDAGIEVREGVLKEECDALNKPFFHFIVTGKPLVIAKYAMTLDGKIATHTGKSKWITGTAARRRVHQDRARYAAVMVGVGTVIADDPMLTARIDGCEQAHQPVRVICDTHLRTPIKSKLVESADEYKTVIVTTESDISKQHPYIQAGCKIMPVEMNEGRIDLSRVISELGTLGLDSVVIEGGGKLLGAAFDLKIVDKVQAYIASKILGGSDAPSPVGGEGVDLPSAAARLEAVEIQRLGDDILIEGMIKR